MNMKVNLNTLIKKIYYLVFSIIFLFGSTTYSQDLISWEVADQDLNRKFIEMYLNKLIE